MNMNREKGFTLLEIIIGLAVASVVATAVYAIFTVQHRIYLGQKQIADLQQNLRTCMYLLEEDIKHACLDPLKTARPSILMADRQVFRFQSDLNENGHVFNSDPGVNPLAAQSGIDPNETLGFRLGQSEKQGLRSLIRDVWEGRQTLADHIETLDFVYLDADGNRLSPLPLIQANLRLIRSVEVTLVARSNHPVQGQRDTAVYSNLRGDVLVTGNGAPYYRRSLSKIIHLRNVTGALP
jgi:prepilin-type N-terminal cleavage/methylation domain-containing protein